MYQSLTPGGPQALALAEGNPHPDGKRKGSSYLKSKVVALLKATRELNLLPSARAALQDRRRARRTEADPYSPSLASPGPDPAGSTGTWGSEPASALAGPRTWLARGTGSMYYRPTGVAHGVERRAGNTHDKTPVGTQLPTPPVSASALPPGAEAPRSPRRTASR